MSIFTTAISFFTKSAVPTLAVLAIASAGTAYYLHTKLQSERVSAASQLAKVQAVADINAQAVIDQNEKIQEASEQLARLQAQVDSTVRNNATLRQKTEKQAREILSAKVPQECNLAGAWGAEIAGKLSRGWNSVQK